MKSAELKKTLEKHRLWLETEGEEGKRADLSEEVLYKADLRGAKLKFADLSGANLEEADLKDADLMGADLSDTDAGGADFSGADLSGADLGGTDLTDADLRGANLEGANLSGTTLSGADLEVASLEFAAFPLWSGGIDVNIDDKQAVMLLYFLFKNVSYSRNVSGELKKLFNESGLKEKANEEGMAHECGKIA